MVDPNFLPPKLPADRVAACIGLVSDTHMPQRLAELPARLFTVLAGVDLLLHAGDVGELWVLDRLSTIAPVVAVHGNDDSADAQRELPYQQVITVAGQRILLWHSHYADRIDEMASRRDDPIFPKLQRSVQRAQRAGAGIAIFGHWHIPLVYRSEGVLVVNPGAFAAGNAVSRQLYATVAILWLRDDGASFVSHVDLTAPERPFTPPIDLAAGFQAALRQVSASILAPALVANQRYLLRELDRFGIERALPPLLRVAHRCWAGEQAFITRADWEREIETDEELPARYKAAYLAILHTIPGEE